jgi:hypothetical protein
VKAFILWKLPMMLLGLGAALVLTPACKAQSEVDPDHFDGTDSWQVALAHQPSNTKSSQAKGQGFVQAQNKKPASGPSLQLAAARESSQLPRQDAVAIQDKRKAAPRKSNKQ